MEKEYGEVFPHHTFELGLALEIVSIYYYLFQSCCAGDKTQSFENVGKSLPLRYTSSLLLFSGSQPS